VIKIRIRILALLLGLACLVATPFSNALADDMTASVTVNAVLDHITVTPLNPSVSLTDQTYQFTATAVYSNAPDNNVTNSANWTSSNNSVATIGPTGLATLLNEGSTTIKAEYQGETANTTLEVTAGTSPPSGGGGGGGGGSGGGGGGDSNGSTTILAEYISAEGIFIMDATAESADGQITLFIPEGTVTRQKNGQPLYSVSINENNTPPLPPADCTFVCLAYDIKPGGTTFDPPALLTFKYYDSQVQYIGVNEENLVLVTWQDGMWVELKDCVVDAVNNTITVPISHLSLFTVMAHMSPASFEVTAMTVTPAEVYPDETVTVSATITNTGDLTGSFEAILTLDNEVVRNQTITLNTGASETIVFNIAANTVGEHQVSLGGLAATFVVKQPPATAAFTVEELNIDPVTLYAWDKANISVYIKNTGDLTGTYPITLSIDDVTVETREVILDGGGSMTVNFTFATDIVGTHRVSIGGLQGVLEVKPSLPTPVPEISGLELNSFSTTPIYDKATNTLISVGIKYQMNQSWGPMPDARLVMTVFHNGEMLEQVPLFTLSQINEDGRTGELSYIPVAGWKTGEYVFRAVLYDNENAVQESLLHNLIVTSEEIGKVFSWWALGAVIGIASILIIVLLILVLYCRRDMLKNPAGVIRYIDILRNSSKNHK
jgi:hypothetical protein